MHFKMVCYADNYEDVVIRRAFPGMNDGFYIDVGAYDPVEHSVTQHFYEGGWRGINVEPNPVPFAKIQAARDRDINLNIGLSNREGSLTLLEAPGACWSVNRNLITGYFGAREDQIIEHKIPVLTLAQICEQHVPPGRSIEFLKVDVEGHEREVIEGETGRAGAARIIVCEANATEEWEPILLEAGYVFTLFEGVNRFYVRKEDEAELRPRISVPANVTDQYLLHGYMKTIYELERSLEHYRQIERAVGENLERASDENRELVHSLSQYQDLTPLAIRLAKGLANTAKRHPRAASIARKIARRLYA